MSETFKHLFTTSVVKNDKKDFKECVWETTYTKLDDGKFVPLYKNTHSLFLTKNNFAQIGVGVSHCTRGAYVIDSDTQIRPETLYYIFSKVFVEPSIILRNPKSGHTQTFFFFTKDIVVSSIKDGEKFDTKNKQKYLDHLHKLNSFMGIGDTHFTGYFAKNPYYNNFERYFASEKEYPFEVLNQLIDNIDTELYTKEFFVGKEVSWQELKENYTEIMAEQILSGELDNSDIIYEDKNYVITEEEFAETETISVEEDNIIETAEKKVKKEERRGKFAENSENRHSTLFHLMKEEVMRTWEIDETKLKEIVVERNKQFKVPLSEKEIETEVMNKATLEKTFKTLIHWNKYREDQLEAARTFAGEIFEENNFDQELAEKELLEVHKWTHHMVAVVFDKDIKEADKLDQKKYKGRYEGRYEGKYDRNNYESVKRNKVVQKVKKWLKENGTSNSFPKKWTEVEIDIVKEIRGK